METSIAKRNFPSCSLCSQFTASQKLPLLFPNAKQMEPSDGNQHRKKKLPLLLTSFAIHCLTKASAFVPQCETDGTSKWEPSCESTYVGYRDFFATLAMLRSHFCWFPKFSFQERKTILRIQASNATLAYPFECLACCARKPSKWYALPPSRIGIYGSAIPAAFVFECLAAQAIQIQKPCRRAYALAGAIR